MGDTESSTPLSTADSGCKAAKDKTCPFCGQAFTSSSLGRHLDLYIRSKNPKSPDGIHLVDEIRKLRGGITRRQAKGSVGTPRASVSGASTPATKKHGGAGEEPMMQVDSPDGDDDGLDVGKIRPRRRDVSSKTAMAKLGLGPAAAAKTPDARRDVSRQSQKADLDQRHRMGEEADVALAKDMALRELLKCIQEASAKVVGASLFDFDPYTLSFPALCLHILPAPPTLFAPTPFAAAESWSIAPPAAAQFEALNRNVKNRLLAFQHQRHVNNVYPAGRSNTSSAAGSPLPTPSLVEPDPQKLFGHIEAAYNHWSGLSANVRQEHWQLEILRCRVRADGRRREAEQELKQVRRELESLKAKRWPAGAPDIAPVNIHLGSDTATELGKHGLDFVNWDYDRFVDKWRIAIRENKAAASGMAAQKPLPSAASSTRSGSIASLPAQQFSASNQPRQTSPVKMEGTLPFTAPPTVNGDTGSDQLDADADADGDDDDDDIDLTPHTIDDDDSLPQMAIQPPPQPTHRPQQHNLHGLPLQPPPLHPSQQRQPQMQTPLHVTQVQHMQHAQAQAQAQVWAAAQHMNQSRNQDFRTHPHQQLSPHVQHIASANNSRRPSLAMMDPLTLNANAMSSAMGMSTGMEGLESHPDAFLRLDMGLSNGFVGSNDTGV